MRFFLYSKKLFSLLRDKHIYTTKEGGYIRKSDLQPVSILACESELSFVLEEEEYFYKLEAFLSNGKQNIFLRNVKFCKPFIGQVKNGLLHVASYKTWLALIFFMEYPVHRALKKDFNVFQKNILQPIQKEFTIKVKKSNKSKKHSLIPTARKLYVSELDQFIVFRPEVQYSEGYSFNALDSGNVVNKEDGFIVEYQRDNEYEEEFVGILRSLHPSFLQGGGQGFFHLKLRDMIQDLWYVQAFESLQENQVEVWGFNELKNLKYSVFRPEIKVKVESRSDWFDTKVEIAFGDNKVTVADLKKAIKNNQNYVLLGDGKHGILPDEWLEKFKQLFRSGKEDGGNIKISKLNFGLLEQFVDPLQNEAVYKELQEKKKKILAFKGIEQTKVPDEINATLRSYQVEGLNWLNFLDEFQWGGILADDMGLGKTLQIITFLQLLKNKNQKLSMVVAPTSLLFNWQDELKKFAPELKYLLNYGSERVIDAKKLLKYDLILTSYGTLCNDLEQLKKIKFNYVILDESQAIKNVTSLRYKAVCSLNARNRIALTGTPVENSTLELFAQMNFVNPGFLSSLNHFKENYVRPIEVDQDLTRNTELKSRISPFILRRTKKEVLTELPDKTEETLYCIMSPEQQKVYDAYRNKYRNQLLGLIDESGLGKNVLHVLEGLTKLRQICDSPQLLENENLQCPDSVKIAELKRHIVEKTGKHKILVFSQFVKMLKLIEAELSGLNIDFEYLDGQTPQKQREQKVKRFQTNEECRVFLISLKAGGVGLNLTEADYVYIVDPWWNPAVENQAIDRCYRMGQKKNVTALRMICKNTIEEKIFELQQHKKAISENILDSGGHVVKNLTREDIEKLFS